MKYFRFETGFAVILSRLLLNVLASASPRWDAGRKTVRAMVFGEI